MLGRGWHTKISISDILCLIISHNTTTTGLQLCGAGAGWRGLHHPPAGGGGDSEPQHQAQEASKLQFLPTSQLHNKPAQPSPAQQHCATQKQSQGLSKD